MHVSIQFINTLGSCNKSQNNHNKHQMTRFKEAVLPRNFHSDKEILKVICALLVIITPLHLAFLLQ